MERGVGREEIRMILQGKTVVVSGVGPGLGREVAALALRDGANVVIGARNEERLAKAAAELDPSGERVAWCSADVSDPARCEALMETAAERFGGLDGVVQVAALDTLFGTLESTSAEDWTSALQVNVLGTIQVARAALPHLEKRGGGALVLIGSQSQWLAPPAHQIAYASSKGALVSAMYHLAEELGPRKIRVNMVIPTWMWGPPVEGYVNWQAKQRGVPAQTIIDEITSDMPLGEIPADEDVAEACIFFCSDRARMITGETLLVNAGQIMR
jgi:NAD(P)-dependent dehydrogenase (short-subunit alcohol dehydrogenase family)